MQNRKTMSGFSPTMPQPHPVTQKKAMMETISRQIKEVINQYASTENYRLKIGFDMESSNLSTNPKRCAFELELCILNPYLHIVVKKISGSFQDAINQAIRSLEKNLRLVEKSNRSHSKPHSKQKRGMLLFSTVILPALTLISIFSGCAQRKMEKEIDTKLQQQEPPINTQASLQKEAYEAVEEDTSLTQEQKIKLLELQNVTRTRLTELREKGIQLRSLLIQDLLTQDDKSDEVALIKRRIKKNENEKLKILFSAIDRTNVILGKDTKIRGKMLQAFMDRHWTSDNQVGTEFRQK